MFFGGAVKPETFQDFSGHIINNSVFGFCFEIIIRTIEVTDRRIPFHNISALLIQPGDVIIVVLVKQVHCPENVLVSERRLLEVVVQMVICAEFGIRFKNSGISEKAIDLVRVKRNLFI